MTHIPERNDQPAGPTECPPAGEDRYRQLTEQLPAITYIVELWPFPRTTYISPQVFPLLGFTPEEWLAETEFWIQQLDPRDCEHILDEVRHHNLTGESFFLEYRVRAKDGRTVWIRNSATYQRDKTGRATAVHGVMLDITARKQAEEWLKALNECMLGFGSDAKANIDAVVARCGETMGATCALYNRLDAGLLCTLGQWQPPPGYQGIDHPEGHICYDVIRKPIDKPIVIRHLPATPYARSDRNVAAYGLQTYVGMAVKCRGQAVGALCVVYRRDVEPSPEQLDYMRIASLVIAIEEERLAAEQVLKRSKQNYKSLHELFRSVADVMPDLLWAKDLDNKYLFANRALCERLLCARDTEEPIGKTDLFFALRERQAHPDNPQWHTFGEICADSDSIVIESGQARQFDEYGNVRGEYLHLDVIKTPLLNDKGEMIGTVGAGRDITRRKQAEKALEENHELLSLFIRHSPIFAYIKEVSPAESRVLEASENFQEMIGLPGSLMTGKTMAELFPAEMAAKITADDWTVVSKGTVLKTDEELNGRNYTTIKFPIIQGGRTLLAGYTLDITERKQAEAKLQERESNFFGLFNTVRQAIYIQKPDGTFIDVNQGAVDMYGYPREEFIGKNPEFLSAPGKNNFARLARNLELAFQGLPQKFEFWGRRRDGTVFPKDVWTVKGRYFGQDVLISLANDITERQRAEDRLRESENLLAEAQSVAGLGSYVLDIQADRWESSDMLDTLFGIGPDYDHSVAGWEARLHPDDRAEMTDYFRNEVLGQGRPFDREYRIIRHDNRAVRWVHGLGKLEFDDRGNPARMIGSIQDITERKIAEIEKSALEAELHQAQKMESVGRLVGGVAHDFNNILQTIMGNVELALEQARPGDPIHHDLLEVQNASRRAADLTRQLLAFARKQTVTPRPIDLNQTVDNMLKMLRRLIGEEIKLVWSPAADLWPVRMDPTQMDQILANLCVNARDAMAGAGEVHIETKNTHVDELNALRHDGFCPGDYVLLMVSDTGCGMGKETQERIFEPFFTTKDMGSGTGLGLSTVYGIVRQNQGHIAVYSEPDKGTTFRIYLPRHTEAAAAPVAEAPAQPIRQGSETLLLVEDDLAILRLTARFVEEQGYTVLAANTPGEALRLAREHSGKIHLLLTDIVMPGMNGRELSERLTALQPDLKCLYMSGYTANVIARQGMLEAGVYFIQKPFSHKELFEKIQEILDHA